MGAKGVTCLLLILLLDLGLRFGALTFDSLYLDESYQSMYESVGQPLVPLMLLRGQPYLFRFQHPKPIDQVLVHFREVDPLCPPLYGVILNRWMSLFGQSDLAVRSLSLVFSVLAAIATATFATLMFGFPAGAMACLVQAISPFDATYAQEVRMYSFLILTATLSMGSAFMICGTKRTLARIAWMTLYVLSTWAMINSHYTALFLALTQSVFFCAVAIIRRDLKLLCTFVIGWLAVALLWAPWLHYFLSAASIRTASFYVSRSPSLWWPFWALLVRIPFNWLSFLAGSKVSAYSTPVYVTALILVGLGAYAISGVIAQAWGQRNNRSDPKKISMNNAGAASQTCDLVNSRQGLAVLLVAAWAVLPALLLWMLDVIESRRVIEIARYIVTTAPAIYFVVGLGMAKTVKHKSAMVTVLLVHAIFVLSNIAYAHLIPQRRPWRQMAETLERRVPSQDLVFVCQYYDIVCLDRYLSRPFRQVGLSPDMGSTYTHQVFQQIQPLDRYWLVSAEDGEKILPQLPDDFQQIEQTDFPHDLHLRLFERRTRSIAEQKRVH